jgi:valyl-tRNA synthetase
LPGERKALIVSAWPVADAQFANEQAESAMTLICDLVVQIRNVRNEYKVDPGRRIQAVADNGPHSALILDHADIFSRLCNVERIEAMNGGNAAKQAATVISADATLHLPLAGMIDLEAERKRLQTELEGLKGRIAASEGKLANESFVSRAKPEIVERERTNLAELKRSHDTLAERLSSLQ